jgi:energy-coupling factor transporter ATP-binding protein EcfA2
MFTRLRLTQFKAWRDTGDIELKPVTMLLGTNSSGKSSLIQSLLLLKQTVQSSDRTIHLNLGGDETSDYFNFGDFDNILMQGASGGREFKIAFDFTASSPTRVTRGGFESTYGQNSNGGIVVRDLLLKVDARRFRATRRERGAFSIIVDEEAHPRGKGRGYAPERSIAFPVEAVPLFEMDGPLVEDLSLAIRRELMNIVYLGPLRRKPERDYIWNKSIPGEVGSDGHRSVDVLLASALTRGNEQGEIIKGVSKWLNRMKVADELAVRQIGRSTRYEVVIRVGRVVANLRDVGIGVSQVLPVLTVAHFAAPGSTIVLEEPEIHLHPLAQSVLAEFLVEMSHARRVQFIVETHSEHLFRRMQTLIAQTKTVPDQCAMFFVERTSKGARLNRLELDEFGSVKNWPSNFFGDSVGEARAQAQARAARAKALANG